MCRESVMIAKHQEQSKDKDNRKAHPTKRGWATLRDFWIFSERGESTAREVLICSETGESAAVIIKCLRKGLRPVLQRGNRRLRRIGWRSLSRKVRRRSNRP